MELQFHKMSIPCMQRILRQTKDQEQTLEIRLNEDMPDIGKVLSCWGQVIIRAKEWRDAQMQLSGGVTVVVMYLPEDDDKPQWVEGWIPFQMKWEHGADTDGIMRVMPVLRTLDARSTGARKLMVRAVMSVCAEALVAGNMDTYSAHDTPEDIQLLQREYPITLQKEAGEKSFSIEEELTLPASCPMFEKMVRYEMRPELTDKKVMADKAVFRGLLLVHIVYMGQDGGLYSWDFDVPFSQYTELDDAYDQDASVDFWMVATGIELEPGQESSFNLKAGLAAQYVVFDRCMAGVVEDAYSPVRRLGLHKELLQQPVILDSSVQTLQLRQQMDADVQRIVDVSVTPMHPNAIRDEEGMQYDLDAWVQMLYYDADGQLRSAHKRWENNRTIACDGICQMDASLLQSGKSQALSGMDNSEVLCDLLMHTKTQTQQGMAVVSGFTMTEKEEPDPARPSIILRRADEQGLWTMAKSCASTVEAIKKANDLTDEAQIGQILIIPVS